MMIWALILTLAHAAFLDTTGPTDSIGRPQVDLYDSAGLQRGISSNPLYIALPPGASTSALQTTGNTSLSSIVTNTQNTVNALNGLSTVSTAARQDTGNTYLSQIATNTASALTDQTATGSITSACTTPASCAASSFVAVTSQGQYTVGVSVTGTFVATYIAEGQNADATWSTLPMFVTQGGAPFARTNVLAVTAQFVVIAGAYQNFRIRATSYTSGSIVVGLDASIAQQAVYAAQMGPWDITNVTGTVTLPTGASTAALQTAGNATLTSMLAALPPVSWTSKNLTSTGTTLVKTGAGILHAIVIGNASTGGTITIYNNTAASGTILVSAVSGTPSGGLLSGTGNPSAMALSSLDISFTTGMTVVLSGGSTANNFTVVYQ